MIHWSDDDLAACLTRRKIGAPAALLAKVSTERAKYRNKKTTVDGKKFDSKAEAQRYLVLKQLQAAGEISGLKRQVRYALVVSGMLICHYVADFVYFDAEMREVVEDVKGFSTKDYKLKKNLMKACLGITLREVRKEPRRAKKPR